VRPESPDVCPSDLSPSVTLATSPAAVARQELQWSIPPTERAAVSGAIGVKEEGSGFPLRASAEFRFAIPSTPAALIAAVRMVRTMMEWMAFERDWVFRAELCFQEALINAHLHGNAADPSREIRVGCSFAPGKVEMEVEDDGKGYETPFGLSLPAGSDPHGRGLFLIRQFMSSVAIHGNGTRIVMSLNKGCNYGH
jgi:serine/threonine-protein kinase RsbW